MEIKEKIPVKYDKTASRIIDAEAVIVLLDKTEAIVLNEVGSRMWEIIDGRKNIGEIAGIVSSEFEVTYEEAIKDTAGFIEDMIRREVVLIK